MSKVPRLIEYLGKSLLKAKFVKIQHKSLYQIPVILPFTKSFNYQFPYRLEINKAQYSLSPSLNS